MSKKRLQWHPAFCAAMRAELKEKDGKWEFFNEWNLTKKPLQVDLVIRKRKGGMAKDGEKRENGKLAMEQDEEKKLEENKKGIRGILATYNIFEYKSPEDTLGINDYYKTVAYACLFRSENIAYGELAEDDISIILVCSGRPLKLLKYLKDSCKMEIIRQEKGIYELRGPVVFPTHIIIAHPKYGGDYPWLNMLSDKLDTTDEAVTRGLLKKFDDKDDMNQDAVLDLIIKANPKLAKEMKEEEDMGPGFRRLLWEMYGEELKADIEAGVEAGIEARIKSGIIQARKEERILGERAGEQNKACLVVKNMFNRGFSAEDASAIAEVDLDTVKKWYQELAENLQTI